ncbi:MAG: filamentous hemagglutinin N-terminal domain-containing protein [Rubrivivax sp.]|nr:filamentous hemagglutinin N-terminal domain-containing protein [Rubrivivax sp.]
MNQGLHRLVFDRNRGMAVAVAEGCPGHGKPGRTPRRAAVSTAASALLAVAAVLPFAPADAQTRAPVTFARSLPAPAQPLPQPYGTLRGADGRLFNDPALRNFVANPEHRGRVNWSVSADGKTGTFNQGDVDRVILNWDRFDIGAGHRVEFIQNPDPSRYVSALNRIWSADPSVILGTLKSNREVILVNANGVYFGRGARVDTGKFVATSLSIADAVFERGLRNVLDGSAVFSTAGTDYLPTLLDSAISVEAGAEIRSAPGGDVLLIAPRVVNQGRIETPQGQAVLAAGDRVYLMSSSDPAQRGLIVAVDPVKLAGSSTVNDPTLGIVENAAQGSYATVGGATVDDTLPPGTAGLVQKLNEIRADSGTVNLVGLLVRQAGQINATTAVKGANGVIHLQAMASTSNLVGGTASNTATSLRGLVVEDGARARVSATGGTVEIAAGSVTQVSPSPSGDTQLAAEAFNPSQLRIEAETITVAGGARLQATGGRIELLAASTRANSSLFNSAAGFQTSADSSRVVVAPGALLSAAGASDVPVDGSRYQGAQRLFRIELADSPVQRDGPLYRQELRFDTRGAASINVANVTGASAGTRFSATEKSTAGGSLRIASEGSVVLGQDATLDVSGGSIRVSATTLENSLLTRDGAVVLFRDARAGTRYDALLDETRRSPSPAYVEGANGGTLEVFGRRLALGSTGVGQVVQGERQRDGTATLARPASLRVGFLRQGGQYLAGLALLPTRAPSIDPGVFENPASADLSGLAATTALSLTQVSEGGFGSLVLRAATITQPVFGALALGVGGQLDMAARTLALDGVFTLPGGTVNLLTNEAGADSAITGLGDIRLSGRTRLDAAGLWTNDTLAGGAAGQAPLQLAGGTVSIVAAHDLLAQPGLDIDVSGGARLSGSGGLSRGRAGSINLGSGRSDSFQTLLQIEGVRFSAFDFGSGGTLSIASPGLWLGPAGASAPAGLAALQLAPDFFSGSGFGNININAYGDVVVASGTDLRPTLSSWLLSPAHRLTPSGRVRDGAADPQPVDESLADRLPVNLSLVASRPLNPALGAADQGGRLVVERGARIELEATGTLTLGATAQIRIGADGSSLDDTKLAAPAGTIRLNLSGVRGVSSVPEATADTNGFVAGQSTWIGAAAELSVAGTAELRADRSAAVFSTFGAPTAATSERTAGSVLGGGRIDIDNQRGYVVLEQGARLNLDGAAATAFPRGAAAPLTLAQPPGRLSITSPEGAVLDGQVSAAVPRDAAGRALTSGGSLALSLGVGGVYTITSGTPYPSGPRELLIGDFAPAWAAGSVRPGDDLLAVLGNGVTRLSTGWLAQAGFDNLQLGAGDRIAFLSSASLRADTSIVLDSPVLAASPGARVDLEARTVAIGDRTPTLSRRSSPASTLAEADRSTDRSTHLQARAQTIEVVGRSALQGFSNVALDAGASSLGEIRFSAVSAFDVQPDDFLRFAGELVLTSGQTFATTAANFRVEGRAAVDEADPGSRITLRTGSAGAATQPPLSVFGRLALQATDIDHQGVLRQPFGSLALEAARTLTLGDASLTSVAGTGQTLLYGSTVNLTQWQQPLTNDYGSELPVDKAISLSAARISTSAGARVDASGGGTILASEFFAGVGGSTDYFDTAGLYAVLPDFGTRAPVSLTGSIEGVDSPGRELVVTMPGSGLAPGAYTLLPARYALLAGSLPKGAFLVRRAADQGSVLLGAPLVQDDGGIVVTGSIRASGSRDPGTPGERFVVEPPAVFTQRSEVRLTDTGQLLAGRAALSDAAAPPLPLDGGAIRIATTGDERSTWQARLSAGALGGRAGTLDVSANRLALVDDLDKTPAAALGVAAASLAGSGAGSVLIGGLRTPGGTTDGGVPISLIETGGTTALKVDLDPSAPLRLEELILSSSGTLDIAAGSRLEAGSTATLGARTLQLAGDGALAYVSANALDSSRSGATGAVGVLTAGAASRLQGSVVGLDATARLSIADSAQLAAGSLALTAPRIAVGALVEPDVSATTLDGALLASVQASGQISLRSYGSIDFSGRQDWAARAAPDAEPTRVLDRLVLDAPVIRGLDGAQVDIAAREVVLRNTLVGPTPALAAGTGVLTLQALPVAQFGRTGGITVGPGTTRLAFDQARLLSLGDLVLDGTGGLTAQGDLELAAARLTATTAADHALRADGGRLSLAAPAAARTLGERVGQGASLLLSAQRVQQDGRLDLPAGVLTVAAAGTVADAAAVRFGAGSSTSVAGFSVAGPEGFVVDGPAGRIEVTARTGAIELLGRLDASAALRSDGRRGEGDAGAVVLRAAGEGGTVVMAAGGRAGEVVMHRGSRTDDRGGSLNIDVRRLGDSTALLAAAAAGGVDHELVLRSREGDLALAGSIRAERLRATADAGSLRLSGTVDARAATGGVVQLAAGQDVIISDSARIDARSTGAGASGGDLLLAAATGRVAMAPGAEVDAGGDDAGDGRIVLRALRSADGSTLQVDPLVSSRLRAGEVALEAVRVYRQVAVGDTTRNITSIVGGASGISGVAGNLGQITINSDSAAFMASAAGALDALGITATERERFRLRPGVEVQAAGNLAIAADWALNGARPGGEAGVLTLRAAGNLAINGSISDGFLNATATAALGNDARAWSYRIAAGADLASADPLAVRDTGATGSGSITIAAGESVRTGAGSIELAAAQDLRLAAGSGTTAPGQVMVAGTRWTGAEADTANALFAGHAASNRPSFTVRGGRLEVNVGRDVVAPEATQLINNWLWRTGILGTSVADAGLYASTSQLAWWAEFSRFRQSLGAFGGSAVRVRAGQDILNLQVMAPTTGWADSRDPSSAQVRTLGGGEVDIAAGRDVLGGQFLAGRGTGRIAALGRVAEAASNNGVGETILAQMGGASWRLQGRESIRLAGSFNPTAAAVSAADNRLNLSAQYFTWGDSAALSLVSAGGAVDLTGLAGLNLRASYGLVDVETNFRIMPSSLEMLALGGHADVLSRSSAVLFPSAAAQLRVWADGSVGLGGPSSATTLAMPDADPGLWPSAAAPLRESNTIVAERLASSLAGTLPREALHAASTEPVRVHAGESIVQVAGSFWRLPKAAALSAGQDIVNLQLETQNLRADDRTTVTAGRNLSAGLAGLVEVGGPGTLDVRAGRQVDLGDSPGLRTIGNEKNAQLPATGAGIRLAAATASALDLAGFEAAYLGAGAARSGTYRDMLRDFVRESLAEPGLDFEQAWSRFRAFPAPAQVALAQRVMAAEFGAVYVGDATVSPASVTASLQAAFERRKADLLAAGDAALAAGTALVLPGRAGLAGAELSGYLGQIRNLAFAALDLDQTIAQRVSSLEAVRSGWRDAVAASLGSDARALDELARSSPGDPRVTAWVEALNQRSGSLFERYREQVLEAETTAAAKAASDFGRLSLPMRLALFDEGFRAAELAGAGSFVPQPVWPGSTPVLRRDGALEMTQSAVITRRGGDISLINPGGGINVGLKVSGTSSTPKGVIALGGGDVFGYARDDFQVNTQRVFIVGVGDMDIWSSRGDIDSGRGANTAVGAPPLAPRRSVDGVVFEIPATTTGSGLGIVPDINGVARGTIGLYPAFGEILALDAFIRAPSIVLGGGVKGADNLGGGSVGGATAVVTPPPAASVSTPPAAAEERSPAPEPSRTAEGIARQSLLTVDLIGIGPGEPCDGLTGAPLDECRQRLAAEPPRPRP